MTHHMPSRPLALLLTAAAVLGIAATASAQYRPYYRGYYRQRVIVVEPPPRIYVAPPPVYVAPPPVHVMQPAPVYRANDVLGVGLRISGTGLEGSKLGLSDMENPAMFGFGLQLRSHVSHHWGLELSADWLHGSDEEQGFSQTTVPVMLSALLFLFPDSAINPYGLFGGGVHFTTLSYDDGAFEHHILEVAGQLGFGVQVKLGDSFAIHGDLRFLSVYKNLGNTTQISNECLQSKAGGQKGFCPNLQSMDPEDKFNVGAQFQAGATYFF